MLGDASVNLASAVTRSQVSVHTCNVCPFHRFLDLTKSLTSHCHLDPYTETKEIKYMQRPSFYSKKWSKHIGEESMKRKN